MANTHTAEQGADSSLIQNISDHTIALALVEAASTTASDNPAGIL